MRLTSCLYGTAAAVNATRGLEIRRALVEERRLRFFTRHFEDVLDRHRVNKRVSKDSRQTAHCRYCAAEPHQQQANRQSSQHHHKLRTRASGAFLTLIGCFFGALSDGTAGMCSSSEAPAGSSCTRRRAAAADVSFARLTADVNPLWHDRMRSMGGVPRKNVHASRRSEAILASFTVAAQ